jgi:hypothetical protein
MGGLYALITAIFGTFVKYFAEIRTDAIFARRSFDDPVVYSEEEYDKVGKNCFGRKINHLKDTEHGEGPIPTWSFIDLRLFAQTFCHCCITKERKR